MKRNQYVGTSNTAPCSPPGFSCYAKFVLWQQAFFPIHLIRPPTYT